MAETITEEELVSRFGTQSQKEYFQEHGKLDGSYKQNILAKAEKYCNVRQLRNGNYSLTKQRSVPINPEYIKSATGLYQYTCPLILDYIMNSSYEKTIVGTVSLAEKSKIVSEYYKSIKGKPDLAIDSFKLNEAMAYDYLKHMTTSLNYYIEQTLKYLKQMQLIIYNSRHLVMRSNARVVGTANGKVEVQFVNQKPSLATDEEMAAYKDAVEQADIYAETKNASERYYSDKAEKWRERFHGVLNQYGITNVVEVYEIWTLHPDKCQEYRNAFEEDINVLIRGLSKEFKNKLCNNAANRIDNIDLDEMKLTYNFLSRVCLGNPNLGKRIETKLKRIQAEDSSSMVTFKKYGIRGDTA